MSITFPYRSDFNAQGSIGHPRHHHHRRDQMDVPPELAEALGGGSMAGTRALRQLLANNGVPLSIGAQDREIATQAQQQAWPSHVQDAIMQLCRQLLAALEQNAATQDRGGAGSVPSARHHAHRLDEAHRCRHFLRPMPTAAEPAAQTTPATTQTGGTAATTQTGGTAATTQTGGTAATTQTGGTPATTHTGGTATPTGLAATSVPYDQLPARMKGGVSPDNGLKTIIVRDEKELDMLPMWNGMHPDAAKSYRDRLSNALQAEGGTVMGFAGYEVEVVGTNGKERSKTPAKPYVSDAQVKDFVNANLNDPGKIAAAMKEHDVSFDRIQAATGYSRKQIVDFVMATSNQELIGML